MAIVFFAIMTFIGAVSAQAQVNLLDPIHTPDTNPLLSTTGPNTVGKGHLQLNVFMPLIGRDLLQSSRLLADVIDSFNDHCLKGLEPNRDRIAMHLNNSLMLVTKLSPHIGYYNAAKIAQHAHAEGLTLREAALALGLVSEEEFDQWMK